MLYLFLDSSYAVVIPKDAFSAGALIRLETGVFSTCWKCNDDQVWSIRMSNKRIDLSRGARPTRKAEASLLAVQAQR
jgi:hypothetical protein